MNEKIKALHNNPLYHKLSIEPIFFEAIDSKGDNFTEYKKLFSPMYSFLLHGRILSDGEIACYSSHYALWQECIALNEPIIVLEDDISFEPHFLDSLNEIMRSQFSFVRLCYLDTKRSKYIYPLSKYPNNANTKGGYYYSLKNTNGTQGYYITPKAAATFLRQIPWDCPVDIAIEFVSRTHIDNIIYQPLPIREDFIAQHTTIPNRTTTTKNYKIPFTWRILKPLYRNVAQIKRVIFKAFYTPPKL